MPNRDIIKSMKGSIFVNMMKKHDDWLDKLSQFLIDAIVILISLLIAYNLFFAKHTNQHQQNVQDQLQEQVKN